MDHMRRKTIRTEEIRTVILDEADEMLNMGFLEDMETIFGTASRNSPDHDVFCNHVPGDSGDCPQISKIRLL